MSEHRSDFNFDIRMQDEYILAESSGMETPENMACVYEEIIRKVMEWNCNRVLYIEGFTNQISLQDMIIGWQHIFQLVEENNIKGRIAVYDRMKDDYSVNLVSEGLANSRGIYAKVFNNLDEAIGWLKQ